jgi:hypothetical protein
VDRAPIGRPAPRGNLERFVLQTLGAGLLDADYAAEPGTVGYVPPITFDQVWSWFSAAEGWLSQAQQARANPDYDLAATLRLPAALPAWAEIEPCPPAHVQAMLTALPSIREHAELALYDLDKSDPRHGRPRTASRHRPTSAGRQHPAPARRRSRRGRRLRPGPG